MQKLGDVHDTEVSLCVPRVDGGLGVGSTDHEVPSHASPRVTSRS